MENEKGVMTPAESATDATLHSSAMSGIEYDKTVTMEKTPKKKQNMEGTSAMSGNETPQKKPKLDKFISETASTTAFKCPLSIDDARHKLEILQSLLLETIAKKTAIDKAFPELEKKQQQIIKQEIGQLGWTRGVKRDQSKAKLNEMENRKCKEVTAKKSRLSIEETELHHLQTEHSETQKSLPEVKLLCSQQTITDKCQTEVWTTTKKWEEEIKNAKKDIASENEKLDKELLQKQDVAYNKIHAWRTEYEKIEVQPLRVYIADIRNAKKSLIKFLKEEDLEDNSFAAYGSITDIDEEQTVAQSSDSDQGNVNEDESITPATTP